MSEEPAGALWRRVARDTQGEDYAARYAARFDQLAAAGEDVHGEAAFVRALVAPGRRVLDAGCGTGRVAERLADLGYDVTGVDVDEAMLRVARSRRADVVWHRADLATLDLGSVFDLVVMAGNVVPFVDDLPEAIRRLRGHLAPEGRLVSGYGLERSDLPPGVPLVPLRIYDAACQGAGLVLEDRFAGWEGSPYQGGGYAVS